MGIITLIISLLLALGFAVVTPVGRVQTSETHVLEATEAVTAEATVEAVMAEPVATEEATPVAASPAPYLSEIYNLLDYGRGIFLPSEWRASAEEQDARTTLTYRSISSSSLVYLEYLRFPGMASSFTVPDYITGNYFDITLSTFEKWSKIDECSKDGLYLYEFDAKLNGIRYDIRYWAKVVAPERVLTVSMDFEKATDDIGPYAHRLFPALPSCASLN